MDTPLIWSCGYPKNGFSVLKFFDHNDMLNVLKCPKILNTFFFHTFWTNLPFIQLVLKIPSGMANSVDPEGAV